MMTNKMLKQIILNSFSEAIIDTTDFKKNTSRSAYFVAKIGGKLAKYYNNEKNFSVNFQKIDLDEKKAPGEWMLDISVTISETIPEGFNKRKDAEKAINIQLEWAIESEFSTSLKQFCDDFGKLLCVQSTTYLYLNGVNQITQKGSERYKEKRLTTAQSLLSHFDRFNDRFYYCFWPSPEMSKVKNYNYKSIWSEIQSMLRDAHLMASFKRSGKLLGKYDNLGIDLFKYIEGGFHRI